MPADASQRAKMVVDLATGAIPIPDESAGKNPAAVELGRLGGQKGGKARAAKLTAEQRSDIGRQAARSRWDRR